MKTTKINHITEYFSVTLVLSYFIVHNINLVLVGITLSLYLINIKFINRVIRSINKNLVIKKESTELDKNDTEIKSSMINIKSSKDDSKLTLVEAIEELGFIPSIDKKDESNAA